MIPLPIHLQTFDAKSGELNTIIETPKGSRNKFDYDEEQGVFKLGGVLPVAASFSFDFGFVPSTLGEDGDPLDVPVLMDEPAFAGCLVPSRLLGVIEAEQTERDSHTERNDRFIAVASKSPATSKPERSGRFESNTHRRDRALFASHNFIKGKQFETLARSGPERALQLIEVGRRRCDERDMR